MQRIYIRNTYFFLLLAGILVLSFYIFLPYLTTLSVAATFAVITYPLYRRIARRLGDRETPAALLTVAITVLVVLAPLSFIGTQVVLESQNLYDHITQNQESLTANFTGLIDASMQRFVPSMSLNLTSYASQGLTWVAGKVGPIFAGTAQTFLHFFLGIIAFYYFLRDGRRFLRTLIDLSPLPDGEDKTILSRLEIAINSIIRGTLVIALLQGVLSGIGLTIFGVPSPTLWGSLAGVGALIPGVGTAIVLFPAAVFLFVTGKTMAAGGLLLWAIIAVGLIDNFLGPILVGRGVRIHPLFILFSVIGGIGFFGPAGFLLGPLVLSLLYALLDIYRLFMLRKS